MTNRDGSQSCITWNTAHADKREYLRCPDGKDQPEMFAKAGPNLSIFFVYPFVVRQYADAIFMVLALFVPWSSIVI